MKNMYKFLLAMPIAFILLQASPAQAQLRFGLRAGLNLSNMSFNQPTFTPSIIPGFHAGAMMEYSPFSDFAIELGALYSTKGTSIEQSQDIPFSGFSYKITQKAEFSPSYLEIPLNFVYRHEIRSMTLMFYVGPYIGLGMGGNAAISYTATSLPSGITLKAMGLNDTSGTLKFGSDSTADFTSMELGVNIGAGTEFNNFQVRAQYGLGLQDVVPHKTIEGKFGVIGISVGYMFNRIGGHHAHHSHHRSIF